jgi:hypothetical protein
MILGQQRVMIRLEHVAWAQAALSLVCTTARALGAPFQATASNRRNVNLAPRIIRVKRMFKSNFRNNYLRTFHSPASKCRPISKIKNYEPNLDMRIVGRATPEQSG